MNENNNNKKFSPQVWKDSFTFMSQRNFKVMQGTDKFNSLFMHIV